MYLVHICLLRATSMPVQLTRTSFRPKEYLFRFRSTICLSRPLRWLLMLLECLLGYENALSDYSRIIKSQFRSLRYIFRHLICLFRPLEITLQASALGCLLLWMCESFCMSVCACVLVLCGCKSVWFYLICNVIFFILSPYRPICLHALISIPICKAWSVRACEQAAWDKLITLGN